MLDGQVPDDIRDFWKDRQFGGLAGIGHMSLDFHEVVNGGLASVLGQIEAFDGTGSQQEQIYRDAMARSCRAVIAWAHRYAAAAEARAATETDSARAACLRRVASACRRVPEHPARTYFEGLQAIALVHLAGVLEGQGLSMSIGLPDRVLARFAPEVAARFAESVALTRAFLLKIAANSFQGRGSKTQAITVGGVAGERDACNAVTRAFLEAFDATPVADPHLFLRWHRGLDPSVWSRAVAMLSRGRSMPHLVNDHAVVPGLLDAGVSNEDAWEYCIVGCNELGIPGRCVQSGFSVGMGFDDLAVVDRAVADVAGSGASVEDVLHRYEALVEQRTRRGLCVRRERIRDHVSRRPFPFCSACFPDCIEAGQDLLLGARYPEIYGLFIRGTANAANALAAVKSLLDPRRGTTIREIADRLAADEPGAHLALAAAPKWGNDCDDADALAVALNRRRDRALRRVAAEAGVPPFAVCHVVRSLHHLDGASIGATLDGRAAGEPVGESIGPVAGTHTAGPTALLNSVLKLDARRWFSGIYNLNLTLPAGPQARPQVVASLAETFFLGGGQELQVGVLDPDHLRQARREPARFRDLVVRVAGLNARFVELSDLEQDELIRRADLAAGSTGVGNRR
jgi:formate C-acetyltransferase